MNTSSTLTVNGQQRARGKLQQASKAMAEIFAIYRFGAAFRNHIARILGQIVVDNVQKALITASFPGAKTPLSPLTVGAKRATGAPFAPAPLFDKGTLHGGIFMRGGGVGKVIVSVNPEKMATRSPGTRGRRRLETVASLMEFGTDFEVTRRMKGFFIKAVRNDGWPMEFLSIREGARLTVPARPFFYPTVQASIPELQRVAAEAVMHYVTTANVTGATITMNP